MSKRLEVTVSDAIYDAVIEQAAEEGFANDRDQGKRHVVVRALKAWLNQRGHRKEVLRMTDSEYAIHLETPSRSVEGVQE